MVAKGAGTGVTRRWNAARPASGICWPVTVERAWAEVRVKLKRIDGQDSSEPDRDSLVGAVTSVLTAAALFLLGIGGDSLLEMTAWNFVPVGAIAAGFIAATGYYIAARMLRVRPGVILLAGVFAISAGTHLYIEHMDVGVLMSTNRAALAQPKNFVRFATTSLWTTRLPDFSLGGSKSSSSGGGGGGGSDSGTEGTAQQEGPHIDSGGNSEIDGMASGVGTMLSLADMGTQLGAGGGGKISQIGGNIDASGKSIGNKATQWFTEGLAILGFALGGVVIYALMRTLPYCATCGEFLAQKGAQTRYFLTERACRELCRRLPREDEGASAGGVDPGALWGGIGVTRATSASLPRPAYRDPGMQVLPHAPDAFFRAAQEGAELAEHQGVRTYGGVAGPDRHCAGVERRSAAIAVSACSLF